MREWALIGAASVTVPPEGPANVALSGLLGVVLGQTVSVAPSNQKLDDVSHVPGPPPVAEAVAVGSHVKVAACASCAEMARVAAATTAAATVVAGRRRLGGRILRTLRSRNLSRVRLPC